MEGSGQLGSIDGVISSSCSLEKNVSGETNVIVSNGADLNNITLSKNVEAMDTDTSCEDRNIIAGSNSKNNILSRSEENSDNLSQNNCNKQITTIDNSNILSETVYKESLSEGKSGSKVENTNEISVDGQLESKLIGSDITKESTMLTIETSGQNITASCSSDSNQSVLKEEIVEMKETNGNIVADNYCNISEGNNGDGMITNDDAMENRKIIYEPKVNNSDTMVDDLKVNRNPFIADAVNKYLGTASLNSKAAYEKDLGGLKLLCDYGSDSDDNNEESKVDLVNTSDPNFVSQVPVVNPCPAILQEYRKPEVVAPSESEEDDSDSSEEEDDSSSSSSTATSSSSSEESDSDNTSENECVIIKEQKRAVVVPKTKGELGLEDLPPIEDLHISVSESECVEIGNVLSIVDTLVVVQSIKGCPALDLDSVLFLDHGHNALGQVFDVFGKVNEACYCVRFNSKDHALQKGIQVGMPVYYAPRTDYSKFVFLADLLKMKGSDASWEHNNEPPVKFLDYSDDEEERRARKGDKPQTRDVEPDETQPQSKKFNRRGGKQGGLGRGQESHHDPDRPSWSTPFNRYPCPSPSPSMSPRPGPQPLIRPPSFRTSGPPPSHYHNAAAGAPAMPPMPSPWAVPPPAIREDFNLNMNIANTPPPQPHFAQNQMRSGGFNMNVGGFGQPPPPPPPSPASRNYMMPTSIPGSGPFAVDPRIPHRSNAPNSFTSSPPYDFGSFRQDVEAQGSFGSQDPVFMNRNVPPPRPPQGW